MKKILAASLVLAAATAAVNADTINATITADNHYALARTGDTSSVSFISRNELGAQAAHPVRTTGHSLRASRSPPALHLHRRLVRRLGRAGLLAQISGTADTYHSGDPRWQVYPTSVQRRPDPSSQPPPSSKVTSHSPMPTTSGRRRTSAAITASPPGAPSPASRATSRGCGSRTRNGQLARAGHGGTSSPRPPGAAHHRPRQPLHDVAATARS